MIDLKDKPTLAAVMISATLILLAIVGNVIGKDFNVNSALLVIIILGILWGVFKLILMVEKRVALSTRDLIILLVIEAILILLILLLFKQIVPDNFLGAVHEIEGFVISEAPI